MNLFSNCVYGCVLCVRMFQLCNQEVLAHVVTLTDAQALVEVEVDGGILHKLLLEEMLAR